MRLEKREITLNEYDSLQDAYHMQKMLLQEYCLRLPQLKRKQTRAEALRIMEENVKDLFLLSDLIENLG